MGLPNHKQIRGPLTVKETEARESDREFAALRGKGVKKQCQEHRFLSIQKLSVSPAGAVPREGGLRQGNHLLDTTHARVGRDHLAWHFPRCTTI